MKNVLLLNADLYESQTTEYLISAYERGAQSAGHSCRRLPIGKMVFNPNSQFRNRTNAQAEPDLEKALKALQWAQHIVVFCPVFEHYIPTKVNGFFDCLFGSESIFFQNNQHLRSNFYGKSARIVSILDQKLFELWLRDGNSNFMTIKKSRFERCLINPVYSNTLGELHKINNKYSEKWMLKMEKFGQQAL